MADALTWANVFNEAFVNAGRVPWFDDETIQRIKDHMSGTLPDETIRDPRPGVDDWYGSGVGYNSGRGPNYGNGNNDWFKVFFKRWSFSQQHNIDLSGGGNATTYYLGAGYMGKEGMYNFADDDYKRYNLRANISTDPARWLKLNFRSAFSRGKNNTPAAYSSLTGGNWMHQIARKLPNTPLKNPDGYYSDYSNVNNFTEGGRDLSTDDQLTLTGETIITPLKGWNITANYTLNGEYYYDEIFNKTVYTYLPSGTKVVEWQTDPNNSLAKSQVNINHSTINLFSSYETNLGNHYFKILGGYIRDYTDYKEFSASNSLLYSNDIPSLNLTYNTTPAVGDIMRRLAIEGFFGRFNYNYQDKYLVELNGRYDASSRFLQGHRWQLYPSVSAGYNISKENFWQPLEKYVNALKIRGSYGTLGDQWGDDPGHTNFYPFYPSLGTVSPSGTNWIFANGREAYIVPPGLVNPNLTWARIKTFDLGADIYFLNNRLSASFDWYKRRTDDFVGPGQALPVVLGAAVPIENNASIETKGFELSLGWSDKIGNVTYYVKGVLSNYKGKVLQYPNPTQLLTTWYPGMTMGEIWGYVTQGLFKSNQEVADAPDQSKLYGAQWTPGDVRYKDLDGNNAIDYGDYTAKHPGDLKVIGNNTPQYSYGLSLGAQYRGFDLSVFLQGVAKRDVWISSNMFWGIVPGGAPEWQSSVFTKTLNYWSADNPDGYFPKIYMSDQMSKNEQVQTRYLQNAAYMRVKNLQIGYALPHGLIRKAHLQQLRLYLSIDNLATVTKLQNTLDPELSIPALEGDGKIYPLQRTFSFGLNIGL
jgi:TonB-linked SusC/RagA family outer membrane protein